MGKNEAIKEHVREHYSNVALRAREGGRSCCEAEYTSNCCGSTSSGDYAQGMGYSKEDLDELPETVVGACAGCGNPTALASLKEGEVVLDLGSGGGIDVFLASEKIGPTGKAIGVDMTQDMIDLAKKNADDMGLKNVEFRLGEIEDLPVEDESVDVIISNCVINLSPDKDKVFDEAYRVLKPGGRIIISDIVTNGELPPEVRNDPDAWAECIAGAIDEEEYLNKIADAGFEDIHVLSKKSYTDRIFSAEIEANKPAGRT